MTFAAILGLVVLSGWLGMRLVSVNSENAELRTRVESLKRQLTSALPARSTGRQPLGQESVAGARNNPAR
jgi:hypothetical protein